MALDPVPTYPGEYSTTEGANNPGGEESRRQGDDQIRRMKASEAHTWPNILGPVNASQDELNTIQGIDTVGGQSIEQRLTYLEEMLPVGTKMPFYQASVPATGWAQDADDVNLDNRMMRVVSQGGSGGSYAGTHNPIAMTAAELPDHPHAASSGGAGGHHHLLWYWAGGTIAGQYPFNTQDPYNIVDGYWLQNGQKANVAGQSMEAEPNHTHTINVQSSGGPAAWTPRYADFCIGVKT